MILDNRYMGYKPVPVIFVAGCFLALAASASAGPPDIKTEGAMIYLADNLDEADNLGWCIDTIGRGFGETLHAHSCKPQGGDVQFSYDVQSRQIRSVTFSGKCMTLMNPGHQSVPFGLLDCVAENSAQQFSFDTETGKITPAGTEGQCVVVGETSRSAGPFMSRDLTLADCETVQSEYAVWRHQ